MPRHARLSFRILRRLLMVGLMVWGGWWLLMDPDSPLPAEWHPLEPLDVEAPRTWLTGMKLSRALASDQTCLAALETGASFDRLDPLVEGPSCGIAPRVLLSRVGQAGLSPVETTCSTALRLAMWERHAVRPASIALGADVTALSHQGSYNCRPIRGSSTRMSTHATAEAIDIRAVTLSDGRTLTLLNGWDDAETREFWRELRDGACTWFVTVLGPDYNALHADHFHMQARGWGLCQ